MSRLPARLEIRFSRRHGDLEDEVVVGRFLEVVGVHVDVVLWMTSSQDVSPSAQGPVVEAVDGDGERRLGHGPAGSGLPDGVLFADGAHGKLDARAPREEMRPRPRRVDDRAATEGAVVRKNARDPRAASNERADGRAEAHLAAVPLEGADVGFRRPNRIGITAVGLEGDGGDPVAVEPAQFGLDPVLRHEPGDHSGCLLDFEISLEAVEHVPGYDHVVAGRDVTAVHPQLLAHGSKLPDAGQREAGHQGCGVVLANGRCGLPRSAAGGRVPLDQQHTPHAPSLEVIGRAGADDSGAHNDRIPGAGHSLPIPRVVEGIAVYVEYISTRCV